MSTIEQLIKEVSEKDLKELNLNESIKLQKLEGLPPNLNYHFLTTTNFNIFPINVFKLNLRKLVLNDWKEEVIPLGIFDMKELLSLFVIHGKLKMIPSDIIKL